MPMVEIDDILAKVGKSDMYSTVDMCKGYYAIQLTEKSKGYTTFCTHNQNYKFFLMPIGLNTAGASYTRLLKEVLKNTENLQNFINNVIAHSRGFKNQLKVIRVLLERTRSVNLKIKSSKTKFCYTKVEFLKHVICGGKIRPMLTNVKKIINAPTPQTKKGVRSLLGAIGFLRKFIPDCSEILKPITDLTSRSKSEKVE